jgi:tetratricopeptide (TPR) repeat protein
VKAVAAANLRTVKTWEDAYYYYYRSPSQAELAQADAYDRQAQALWALAERHLEAAAKTSAGKPLGFYYAGVLAKRRGNAAEARAAFEKCVALTPDNAPAWDALTNLYYMADMKLEAALSKSAAANLQHTTAGHLLRYAWGQLVRTANKSAADVLEKAMNADAADPRNCAYLATVAAGRGDVPGALAWWRCAAALEAASAELNGVSFVSQPFETITAAAAGRALAINLRLGQIAIDQNQPDVAASAYQANIAIADRLAKLDRFSPLPTSQLPDMQTDPTILPEADTALSLLARSQLGLGRALLKQNRIEEAFAQFNGLYDLTAQIPPTVNPGYMLGDPQVLAKIEMLKVLIDRKQYQQAQQVGRSGNRSGGASRENVNELNRLIAEVESHLAQDRYDQADREMQQIQQQQRQQIEQFQRERAARDAARRRQGR